MLGIVFVEEEDDLLCPIGLHYSSDAAGDHLLQSILQDKDYCEKHRIIIEGLDLTFENPKLFGTLRFDARHTEERLIKQEDTT